ncbi:hypothetical protein TYRP_019031 [Tyrophagus putrescentiae]|nr:hypothetical protein TYRP_019031 [Tyrophagus putrescentiae]
MNCSQRLQRKSTPTSLHLATFHCAASPACVQGSPLCALPPQSSKSSLLAALLATTETALRRRRRYTNTADTVGGEGEVKSKEGDEH